MASYSPTYIPTPPPVVSPTTELPPPPAAIFPNTEVSPPPPFQVPVSPATVLPPGPPGFGWPGETPLPLKQPFNPGPQESDPTPPPPDNSVGGFGAPPRITVPNEHPNENPNNNPPKHPKEPPQEGLDGVGGEGFGGGGILEGHEEGEDTDGVGDHL